jgi:hypothetical protein
VTAVTIGRPEADEFSPYYAEYIGRVPEADPVGALAAEITSTRALLGGVAEKDAGFRYAPDKWSVKDVVGHLCDVERVMTYRALCIARGDTTPLPGFDENAFVPAADFGRQPLADLVNELGDVRRATLALFRSFSADDWRRKGNANGNPISVRALGYILPGHERHHVMVLRDRYGLRG